MGIYIKGMEMPVDCRDCPFEMYYMNCGETKCRATGKILADFYKPIPFDGRAEECPLVEVPQHGRLIDADAMTQDLNKSADDCEVWKNHAMEEGNDEMVIRAEATEISFLEVAMRIKMEYPTIIEAEEET